MTGDSNAASPAPENQSSDAAMPEAVAQQPSTPVPATSDEAAKPDDAAPADDTAPPDDTGSSDSTVDPSADGTPPTGTGRSDAGHPDAGPSEATSKGEVPLRMRIGSLRDSDGAKRAKPKPSPVAAPRAGKSEQTQSPVPEPTKYPPPNIRQQLPPEMEEEVEAALGGMSLDDMIESSSPSEVGAELEPESRLEGRVVTIRREDVFLELGGRNQGVVPLGQFDAPPEPGTTVEVQVQRFNDEDGLYEVSLPGATVDVGDWDEVSEGLVVEAVVTGHNNGGLECQVGSLRGFIPMSQIALYRVENIETFVGDKFSCVVTEADRERRNLVLSRRAILERERGEAKQKLLEELAVGQERDGVVTKLLDFGAFVDLGGIDGLVHISQISWDRIGHPSEVFEVGQKVKVKVKKIDPATGKIGLGYCELMESPWTGATEKYPVAAHVSGTVTKILDFGALVRLEPGIAGMIHISELSHQRVHRVSDIVQEGQEVEVQVLNVDADAQRMSLSMKALETAPAVKRAQAKQETVEPEEEATPFEPSIKPENLKGGLDRGSGGDQFGLNW